MVWSLFCFAMPTLVFLDLFDSLLAYGGFSVASLVAGVKCTGKHKSVSLETQATLHYISSLELTMIEVFMSQKCDTESELLSPKEPVLSHLPLHTGRRMFFHIPQ